MSRRLSIAGMLGYVALVAYWLAAIRSSSVLWTRLAATFTLAALLTSVLGAILSRGLARSFWLGFALFGWVYLGMVAGDWFGGFGQDLCGGLSDLAELVIPPVPDLRYWPVQTLSESAYKALSFERREKIVNFVGIGRMGLSLLFAMVGGLIGRWFAARRETSQPNRPQPD